MAGVEIPKDILGECDPEVLQGGMSLAQDRLAEDCWLIDEVSQPVTVTWEDADTHRVEIPIFEKGYLLFKLSGREYAHGRGVKAPSHGTYLVIAPDSWKRDTLLSGSPAIAPEQVCIEGLEAHFFVLRKGGREKIAFLTPDGRVVIEPRAPQFELVGHQLGSESDGMGPLFGERPPRLRALDNAGWKSIATVVMGREGRGRGKWRTAFRPNVEEVEQDLSAHLGKQKSGWYFIRLYDANDDLVESLDFRFLAGLIAIQVEPVPVAPGEGGHRPLSVSIHHAPGCLVKPIDIPVSRFEVARGEEKTVLTIPADPYCDDTVWLVGSPKEGQEKVDLHVNRLWWQLGDEHTIPAGWTDQIFTLSCEAFSAVSQKAFWVRLPGERWTDRVRVGFDPRRARDYLVKVTERTVCIPLREFGDSQELQGCGISPLYVWAQSKDERARITVAKLVVSFRCALCEARVDTERQIIAHVEDLHLPEYYRPLTYEELKARIPSLPLAIYRCGHCATYAESGGIKNPTSTIYQHLREEHPGATKAFRVVEDVDEIRRSVIASLPHVYQCKICGGMTRDNPSPRDLTQHLVGKHRSETYQLQ